jgi:hypothetical protein
MGLKIGKSLGKGQERQSDPDHVELVIVTFLASLP